MPLTYTPTPVALSTVDLTLPQDGERRVAASVNAPLGKLADGIAWNEQQLAIAEAMAALSYPTLVAPTIAPHKMRYEPETRKWVGFNLYFPDHIVRSGNLHSWSSTSELNTGPEQLGKYVGDLAFDNAGNIVAVSTQFFEAPGDPWSQTNGLWYYSQGTGTWAAHDGIAGSPTTGLLNPSLAYDTNSSRWALAAQGEIITDGVGEDPPILLAWKADLGNEQIAWNSVGPPVGMPTDCLPAIAAAPSSTGILVMQGTSASNAGNVYLGYSTDGGATWSAVITLPLTFAQTYYRAFQPIWVGRPWPATTGKFLAYASSIAAKKTTIFSSPDGATWTEVVTLTDFAINSCAAIDEVIVASDSTGQVIVSVDAGATWRYGTMRDLGPVQVVASAAQYVLLGAESYYPSISRGPGLLPVS